ncbi:hypothetical protein [Hyalangium minutum]|uniref:Uncharacterized protein n=1 Tax=Hyalangium minutum TaxID=394096 RepID=A0A085VZR1_9BACT|nr:hypothetical protein [Hyalangium minutum]KFE60924.1 hypothetical protein DB31_4548 [Hyalangium minutum]
MKIKTTLAAAMLMTVLAASEAWADPCTLTVNQSSSAYIYVGQSFTYEVNVPYPPGPYAGPMVPYYHSFFSIVFYGTKNGVEDIPGGETYPAPLSGFGTTVLTGYGNPGGYSGNYQRYAKVINNVNGNLICWTNVVWVYLQ